MPAACRSVAAIGGAFVSILAVRGSAGLTGPIDTGFGAGTDIVVIAVGRRGADALRNDGVDATGLGIAGVGRTGLAVITIYRCVLTRAIHAAVYCASAPVITLGVSGALTLTTHALSASGALALTGGTAGSNGLRRVTDSC